MGCRTLPSYGVDIDIYFADYVGACAGTGTLVYLGGRTFIQFGRDILPLAEIKVFTRDLAPVRNRRNSVLFLCGSLRRDFGCLIPFPPERVGPPAVAGYGHVGALGHHYPTAFRGPPLHTVKGIGLTFRFGWNIMCSL